MTFSRRDTLKLGGALSLAGLAAGASRASQTVDPKASQTPGKPNVDYRPVITPNGSTLPYKQRDGVKVFHMIAEEVAHEFTPGLEANCWGYNGQVHGPTIEAVEGDTVRIYVTNKLPAATTVHWHGLIIPSGMDGVGGLNQHPIEPDETYVYEFKLIQHGTFMYHSHHDEMTQMAMGMMGMIVIHPRKPAGPLPDRDFVMMLSEWSIEPGTNRPDPNAMADFNVLTFNARCFPGTDALVAKQGERVRIRYGNLSAMDHHPVHLHGYAFKVTETDGGPIPKEAQWPETTVLVPTGATRTVEFIADNPGDWAMHCHMTHHVMNQMGHDLDLVIGADGDKLDEALNSALPGTMMMGSDGMGDHGKHVEMGHMNIPENSIPMVGANGPMSYITMGGMFTILKVRPDITSYDDPGWYEEKPEQQARLATDEELTADGIAL
ncbi:multicopper oxidase family protein [Kordiimonas laminariae]|uniref:multicopper oxidase family protein n=1 Tax=Kordiimonas laminariae TaxID=2917717 RepID=UPI001FF33DDC|nr:copper oxidase [Kordiimonas laminariae]MCK0070004.1 copper oxidase [Kordiimonas laminariae]